MAGGKIKTHSLRSWRLPVRVRTQTGLGTMIISLISSPRSGSGQEEFGYL
jgi:hypothetical protein